MVLNIIHDSRRQEKFEPLISELSKCGIEYEIWPCLLFPDIVKSISASHKMIVEDAKHRGLVECFIGEDDLFFPSSNGWEWFLKNKPLDYDIYAGASYYPINKFLLSGGLIKVDCLVGLHLYSISQQYYDQFLNTPESQHIDTAQKSDKMYVCYPFAALQRAGYSANNKAICDYNTMLNKEDIYV